MILHWLTTAWRSLIANPLFSLITIASLSIGCAGALLAGSLIRQHLTFDNWIPHAQSIGLVRYHWSNRYSAEGKLRSPRIEAAEDFYYIETIDATQGKLQGVIAQTGVVQQTLYNDDAYGKGPIPAGTPGTPMLFTSDGDFFKVFDLPFIEGNAQTALDVGNVVLTRDAAFREFGEGPWIGKVMVRSPGLKGFRVGGVIRDLPPWSRWKIDAIMQRETQSPGFKARVAQSKWDSAPAGGHWIRFADADNTRAAMTTAQTVVHDVFNKGRAAAMALESVAKDEQPLEDKVEIVPLLDLHLGDPVRTGLHGSGDSTVLATLGGAAGVLLIVSAFNYVTLSLARAFRRRREVGIRKALGAGRDSIAQQYLSESLITTTVALAVGFGLAELLYPSLARMVGQPAELFQLYSPSFLLFALAGGVLLAAAVAAYPAFYLAHVRPHTGLETGEAAGPGIVGRIVSRGLIAVQFASASTLLVIAMVMAAQAYYIAHRPLGFDTENLHLMRFSCSGAHFREPFETIQACDRRMQAFARETIGAGRLAYMGTTPLNDAEPQDRLLPIKSAPGLPDIGQANRIMVDTDMLTLLNAKLLAGRLFDSNSAFDRQVFDRPPDKRDEPYERVPVVVTRAFLSVINADSPQRAIGAQFIMSGVRREIIGVIEDWHQRSLRFAVDPIVFTPNPVSSYGVFRADAAEADAIAARMAEYFRKNDNGIGRVVPLNEGLAEAYQQDQRIMLAVTVFSLIIVAVACLGTYGLTAFDIQRRVREIGIRKALGASPGKVAGMVLSRQVLVAAAASLFSWPVAWWLSSTWLQQYAYRTNLAPIALPIATLTVIAFAALAVALNTARAAAIRPSFALRSAT